MKTSALNNFNFTSKNISGISKEINDEMPKFVRYLASYPNRMGEKQDIYINAVGAGIIAPVFMVQNPFTDMDKRKKIYAALRQTAMVATGIVLQTLITIPLVNKYLDNQIKKGAFGDKFTLKPENMPNIKAFKRVTNLIAVMAVIPLTATIMNKWYPWVMEKFPNNNKRELKND